LLDLFSESHDTAVIIYINLVRDRIGLPIIWHSLESQDDLGDDTFIVDVKKNISNDNAAGELKKFHVSSRGL
jgi:hypothetical protein